MASANKGGSRPVGRGARSVGAAGGSNPNGAILDDTAAVLLQQSQRFKAWKEGYRNKGLKPNPEPVFDYSKSPKP